MIEFLNTIDTQVFLFFNNTVRIPALDNFMMIFSGKFVWIPMYASLLYLIVRSFSPRQALIYVLGIALGIALADQTCSSVIRPLAERLRPSNLENPLSALTIVVNDYRGGAYGFPSCHAANSFALAAFTSLLMHRRRFTLFIFGWAAFNSFTRIHLGVHYPGDLLVGAVIGSAFGWIVYRMARALDVRRNADLSLRLSRPLLHIPVRIQITDTISLRTATVCVADIMTATCAATIVGILIASFMI